MKKILLLLLLTFSICLQAKDIKVIVPYSAGGANDRIARIIEKELSNNDYTFVVEFRPGANGAIAAAHVANIKNDTALMVASNGFIIAPLLNASVGYDPLIDFTLVRYIGADSLLLVVKNDGSIKNFKEFIKLSQTKTMPYGSVGIGSISHLTATTIAKGNKNFIHVPYKGMSAVLPDLLSGNIKWTIDAPQNVNNFISNGNLIPIAAYTPSRIPGYSNIPTVRELGIDDYNLSRWYAVLANQNADRAVVLYVRTRLAEPAIQEKFNSLGLNTSEQLKFSITDDSNKMKQLLKHINLE